MKRRHSAQPRKLRDRRSGQSPWRRHSKTPYKYSAATLAAVAQCRADSRHSSMEDGMVDHERKRV